MTLSRWNDDRLDDLAEEVRRMALIVDGIGAMAENVKTAAADAKHARAGVHRVANDMASSFVNLRNDMTATEIQKQIERKSDRRWYIVTALTCVGMIIAAVGIIVGSL